MGFYGNISSVNKSTFQFDKIYSNRAEMEDNCKNDGVFIGRYVLVDYDQELSAASILATLRNEGTLGEEALGLVGYQIKIKSTNEETQEEDIIDLEHITITSGLDIKNAYTLKDNRIKDALDEDKDVYCVVLGYLIGEQVEGTVDFSYSLKSDITPSLYKASIGTEIVKNDQDEDVEQEYLEWTLVQDLVDLDVKANSYLANYRVDSARFPNLGRGWDSTVWQKTYKNNEAAYVMIAELNSVVPTFDVTTDAPTEIPLRPHYDTDTSNVYYRLHVQPSWGMRVRASDGSFSFDNKTYPSDVKGNFIIDQKLVDNNARSRETGFYPENIWENSHILEQKVVNKDLAIYFNKDGFNKKFPHLNEDNEDIINMKPTGYSTNKYYSHKIEDENGNTIREEGLVAQQYPDTYELSIVLPSIGNTISKIWDIVYGEGAVYDALGKFLWDKDTKKFAAEAEYDDQGKLVTEATLMRNTVIEWNTNTGIRLVNEYNPYNKEALNSMAGIINTVHDLMGMIIVEKEITDSDINAKRTANNGEYAGLDDDKIREILLNEFSKNWDPEKIYYVNGKYYYKARAYDFKPYTANDGISGKNITDVTVDYYSENDDPETGGKYIEEWYFRQSEETYDNYHATRTNAQGDEEEYIESSTYYNYYKVPKDYTNILENAVYGKLKLLSLPNLSFENYGKTDSETEDKELYYYDPTKKAYVLADTENSEKTPVAGKQYYKIKFSPVSGMNLKYWYVPSVYWAGMKIFRTEEELQAWNDKNDFESDDFDTLRFCVENTPKEALSIIGVSVDNNGIVDNNGVNNKWIGYKFLLGVELNPSKSTYILVDKNMVGEKYTQQDPNDFQIVEIDEDYNIVIPLDENGKVVTDSANKSSEITEKLQNVRISIIVENDVELLEYNYTAAQYYNKKNLKEDDQIDITDLKTLLQWQTWALENDKALDLVRSTKLVREISQPAYTINKEKGAIISKFENSEDIGYYYQPLSPLIEGRDAKDFYIEETLEGLATDQGRARIRDGKYFQIDEQSEAFVYFNPQENYYYKDAFGNYLKENNAALKEAKGQNLKDIYYKLISFTALADGYNIFIPNMYHEVEMENDGRPKVDEDTGKIQSTPIENSTDIKDDKIYQLYEDLYVKPGENGAPADKNGIFAAGTKWNINVTSIPKDRNNNDALTLSRKTNTWEARELKDFGDTLNTINGLIVKINQKLADGDMITRDQRTVQGAINTLNDIIAKFSILIPGEFAMVDTYGRVHSGDWDSKQKSSTQQGTAPAIPIGEPTDADDGRWIKLTTTSGTSPDFKPHIKLEHMFRAGIDTTSTSNLNTDEVASNNDSDKIQLYTPILDNMGHVVANNIETVTLPYGFKTVSIGAESSTAENLVHAAGDLVAENTQDTLTINPGNKWMKLASTVGSDSFSIGHLVQTIDISNAANSDINNNGDTITIQDISNDEAGHITANKFHTYTLPYGFKTITTGENDNLVADNTQDTAVFSGDSWIQTTASSEGVSFTHIGPVAVNERNVANLTPNFGGTFSIEDWRFDEKGHKAGLQTHTVKMPDLSLVNGTHNNTAAVVTSLTLADNVGVNGKVFTQTTANVGTLPLTGYNIDNNNDSVAAINSTDSINTAIQRLEYRLDDEITNSRDNAINEATTNVLETVIGSEEDAGDNNTINGAKAYADEQIAQITVTYVPMIDDLDNPGEKIPDPNAEPTTLTLNELFTYIKGLEQRIYELEHPEEGNNEGGGE